MQRLLCITPKRSSLQRNTQPELLRLKRVYGLFRKKRDRLTCGGRGVSIIKSVVKIFNANGLRRQALAFLEGRKSLLKRIIWRSL